MAAISRAKVGYQQIRRHKEMALSNPLTFPNRSRSRLIGVQAAELLARDEPRRIAGRTKYRLPVERTDAIARPAWRYSPRSAAPRGCRCGACRRNKALWGRKTHARTKARQRRRRLIQ